MKNKLDIKAIVSDLDGTIIREGEIMPNDYFFDVVHRIMEKGIPFVIASGRQYLNLKRNLSPISDKINYIAENGCLIRYQDEVIYKASMERNLCLKLLQELEKEADTEIMISGALKSYLKTSNMEFVRMIREDIKNDVEVISGYEEIQEDIIKIAIWWKSGIPEKEKMYYRANYQENLNVVDGGNGWLDFNVKGSGKGEALYLLAEKMGLSVENFVAFGDNENDITLLKTAGKSFAVSRAKRIVQESADEVCDEVVDVLEEMFLKQQTRHIN